MELAYASKRWLEERLEIGATEKRKKMSSVVAKLRPLLMPQTGKHTGTIIFLHGSGDTGYGVMSWISSLYENVNMTFPQLRIIYPTAPERPYTPMGGQMSSVWFDRRGISPFVPEHTETTEDMCTVIDQLIAVETNKGIPRHRIALGGFSMGGAMSLYYGLKYGRDLGALFGLSAFLAEDSMVYKVLDKHRGERLPPIFQCHGQEDPLVHHDWGRATHDKLRTYGANAAFHSMPNMYHDLQRKEMDMLQSWIVEHLPDE